MKKTALAIALFMSGNALAESAQVIDVNPITRTQTQYENVETTEYVCNNNRSNDGLIERSTAGVFGSAEGMVGTAIGAAIGDKIGGGGDNRVAQAVGGILGNRIGNNVARKRSQTCEPVTRLVRQPYTVEVVSHYNVTVEIDGNQYTVRRNFQPSIGSHIPVQLSVR